MTKFTGDAEAIVLGERLGRVTMAIEQTVRNLNEVRASFGLPALQMHSNGFSSASPKHDAEETLTALLSVAEAVETGAVRRRGRPSKKAAASTETTTAMEPAAAAPTPTKESRISKQSRSDIGARAREDWAVVREAGIATTKRPSREMVARGRKIIDRRKAKAAARKTKAAAV